MTHAEEATAAVVDYLAEIEETCRRAGHENARAVFVIRGPAECRIGACSSGLMISGLPWTEHFKTIDAALDYARAIKPSYESGIGAWFQVAESIADMPVSVEAGVA